MIKKVWKVGIRMTGELTRSFGFLSKNFSLDYTIGTRTVPTIAGSALFAFDCLANARLFLLNNGGVDSIILECSAQSYKNEQINLIPISPFRYIHEGVTEADEFWNNPDKFILENPDEVMPVPLGTVLCDWIKPIEIV